MIFINLEIYLFLYTYLKSVFFNLLFRDFARSLFPYAFTNMFPKAMLNLT